jgi:hypothetical protein
MRASSEAAMRVYVETTVWSFAFADDSPDLRAITLSFFERCRVGMLEPMISALVIEELAAADEPLRSDLLRLVREIAPALLPVDDECRRLADAFVRLGAVPPSKPQDAAHVAAAFASGVDVLVSWNFKHIANVRRADRFNGAAAMLGLSKPLRIVTPTELLDEDAETL